jgi:hypothetical protein
VGELRPEIRAAVEAVARHFSATWHEGGDLASAYVTRGGRRIAVEIGILARRSAGRAAPAKPRLRYDRVALRFVRDLRERLRPALANGEAAILTIRAPILQAGKTVDALEKRFRSRRGGSSGKAEMNALDFGNRIGIRFLRNAWRGSEVLAFVHSEGSKPAIIANAAQSLLECMRAKAGSTGAAVAGERWLVLLGASALGNTYRDACLQLSNPAPFEKIVLVAEGGRVEPVAG